MFKSFLIFIIVVFSIKSNAQNNSVFNGGNGSGSSCNCAGSVLEVPLPVELISLTARVNGQYVVMEWITATEINNAYFTVERSEDILHWESIVNVNGAGNSNSTLNYSAIDYNPLQGLSYYRLRQADYDGRYNYSDMVSVNFTYSDDYILIFPNPVTDNLTIYFNSNPEELIITDIQGNIVKKLSLKETENSITFPVINLQESIYFITVKSLNKQLKYKLIKIRN